MKAIKVTKNSFKLMWERLPHISLYIFAFWALFWVGQQVFYRVMPATYFIEYGNVDVSTVEENSDVPFTICRKVRGNYHVTGTRTIFKIPNGGPKTEGKYITEVPVDMTINRTEECADRFITAAQYSHKEGTYYFRTCVDFFVGGVQKHTCYESTVYRVIKVQLGPDEIEAKIKELEDEIKNLKQQLAVVRTEGTTSTETTTTVTTRNGTNTPSSNPPRNNPPEEPQEPEEPNIVQRVILNPASNLIERLF